MSNLTYKNRRTHQISIKWTEDEYYLLRREARDRNITVPQLFRNALSQYIGVTMRTQASSGSRRHMTKEALIEEFLRHNSDKSYTSADIGKVLGIPARTVAGIVTKMDTVTIIRGVPNMFAYGGGGDE